MLPGGSTEEYFILHSELWAWFINHDANVMLHTSSSLKGNCNGAKTAVRNVGVALASVTFANAEREPRATKGGDRKSQQDGYTYCAHVENYP